jgi:hypothetical protein
VGVDEQDPSFLAISQLGENHRVAEMEVAVQGDESEGYAVSVLLPGGESLASFKTQTKAEAGEAIYRVICDLTRRLCAQPI